MIAKKIKVERNLIKFILEKGESDSSKLFIIRGKKNGIGHPRWALIVSKKISNKAVDRNRVRRRTFEAIRLIIEELNPKNSFDLILIPKKGILASTYQEIESDIRRIISKNG